MILAYEFLFHIWGRRWYNFYRLGIDDRLSRFVGLKAIKRSVLKQAFVVRGVAPPEYLCAKGPSSSVTPTLAVLPMGFSWAFWLSQQVHSCIARSELSDVQPEQFIVDGMPPQNLLKPSDYACMLYADNANHLALSVEEVNLRREQLSRGLKGRGLLTHEVIEGSELVECLGVEIAGFAGEVRPTPQRISRIYNGLQPLIRGRPTSGKELERVLGHVTFVLLLRRPLLAALNRCYA